MLYQSITCTSPVLLVLYAICFVQALIWLIISVKISIKMNEEIAEIVDVESKQNAKESRRNLKFINWTIFATNLFTIIAKAINNYWSIKFSNEFKAS